MILEEIKSRRFRVNHDSELDRRLIRLAQGLTIDRATEGYIISVEGKVVITLATDELNLYIRGDMPKYIEEQTIKKLHDDTTPDKVLEQNRTRTNKILDLLLHFLEADSSPAP
jgi:hypothetical protein